jgi:hypothetical protein
LALKPFQNRIGVMLIFYSISWSGASRPFYGDRRTPEPF